MFVSSKVLFQNSGLCTKNGISFGLKPPQLQGQPDCDTVSFSDEARYQRSVNYAKDKAREYLKGDKPIEYMIVISEDGEITGEVEGDEHSCSLKNVTIKPNSTSVHGHPVFSPLSPKDIDTLLTSDIKTSIATTEDGFCSEMTKNFSGKKETGWLELEEALMLKALEKMGIDANDNEDSAGEIIKEYISATNNVYADFDPKLLFEGSEESKQKYAKILQEMKAYLSVYRPYIIQNPAKTIMDNYKEIQSFLNTEEGFQIAEEYLTEQAEKYNMTYKSYYD